MKQFALAAAPGIVSVLVALVACSNTPKIRSTTSHDRKTSSQSEQPIATADLERSLAQALAAAPSMRALRLGSELERRGRALSETEREALVALADALPASELVQLPAKTAASAIVDLRLALVARHRGDRAATRRHMLRANHADFLRVALDDLRMSLEVDKVDPQLLAVLLPMSGPHAAIGEELWAGMSLAMDPESSAKVSVFDTQGTEAGAVKAVQEAVKSGALLALGPAGRLESRAAAGAASASELPIALMAPEARAADAEADVFRMALSPSFEAEQAAIVAVELGYRLLAVMTPRDELGRSQTRAFIKTAKAAGAEVVSVGSYDPSGANLEQDFKKFLSLEVTVNRRYRQHLRTYGRKSWKSFTPILAFDFLYMPDTVERGSLAASYLPFFNVEVRTHDDISIQRLRSKHKGLMPRVVQLMGGSSWLDPSLGARGGSAVEGALVIGTCPGGHGIDLSERGRAFSKAFLDQQGREPSTAASAANDAMTMALAVREWAAGHGGSRGDAARALRTAQLRDGVCGTQTMDSSGQLQGEIEVLRVQQGHLEIYEY